MLLLLEDDAERVQRFTAVLHTIDPGTASAGLARRQGHDSRGGPHLPATRVISLDHDLEPLDNGRDPGDGLEVVKFLVAQPVVCPVIIHISNGQGATWMAGEFELAGWRSWRVARLGDDWVEVDWHRLVKRLLKKPRRGGFRQERKEDRRWWFVLRDGDACEVQLLDRRGKAEVFARFAPKWFRKRFLTSGPQPEVL